jgi:hypothetical protein
LKESAIAARDNRHDSSSFSLKSRDANHFWGFMFFPPFQGP